MKTPLISICFLNIHMNGPSVRVHLFHSTSITHRQPWVRVFHHWNRSHLSHPQTQTSHSLVTPSSLAAGLLKYVAFNYSSASPDFPSSNIASYVLSITNSIYLGIFLRASFIDVLLIHLVISQNIALLSSIFISTLLKGNHLSYPYARSKVLLKKTRSHKLE